MFLRKTKLHKTANTNYTPSLFTQTKFVHCLKNTTHTIVRNMSTATPNTVYLKDYQAPAFLVENIDLRFELGEETTTVTSTMNMRRNPARQDYQGPLVLDGDDVKLISLRVAQEEVKYALTESTKQSTGTLKVDALPSGENLFEVNIVTELKPQDNTTLSGLYRSNGTFCTQCEAEGFRRITFFPDRPDVMSRYRTTIIADRERYPVLLSNGNLEDSGEMDNGKHYAVWNDPFPKPSYLFALVAGKLDRVSDKFVRADGRPVELNIYVDPGNKERCGHAMHSLKKAMKWDEEKYGRIYDLDLFNVVAIDDFNMGAMENKSLNIFNSRFVLANTETATDIDFANIESVVAHEYFHNWTGNRVTCRDWFQLSLKEGLTVFREHEFAADMNSRAVKRIEDATLMRTRQFAEDSGPTAHPVRPDSYMEINNFYTLTVYEKGAEVIRMMHTLVGPEAFRKGTDLYFERHDGCAVTCDDFVSAIEDASGYDLSHFRLWYSQAGTPEITVRDVYDASSRELKIQIEQKIPPTSNQDDKKPMHIPIAVGLLDKQGNDVPLKLKAAAQDAQKTAVLDLKLASQEFTFVDVPEDPVISVLRNFSAPVKVSVQNRSEKHLQRLMAYDSDAFCRWEAAQEYSMSVMKGLVALLRAGKPLAVPEDYLVAFERLLTDTSSDPALRAKAMTLPSESLVADVMTDPDPVEIHTVREHMMKTIGERLFDLFRSTYDATHDGGEYKFEPIAVGQRALKGACLVYLVASGRSEARQLALNQMRAATNMTDEITGLNVLISSEGEEVKEALEEFYNKWKDEYLVVLKWLGAQAMAPRMNVVEKIVELLDHPSFSIKNPNCCYALLYRFALNPIAFHGPKDGAGYHLLADQILRIDEFNSQVAARIVSAMSRWYQYPSRAALIKAELERIKDTPNLSRDVFEIVSKSLAKH